MKCNNNAYEEGEERETFFKFKVKGNFATSLKMMVHKK